MPSLLSGSPMFHRSLPTAVTAYTEWCCSTPCNRLYKRDFISSFWISDEDWIQVLFSQTSSPATARHRHINSTNIAAALRTRGIHGVTVKSHFAYALAVACVCYVSSSKDERLGCKDAAFRWIKGATRRRCTSSPCRHWLPIRTETWRKDVMTKWDADERK